jgi:hypothetical protein
MDGAGAAGGDAAAVFRARETDGVAQHPEQGRRGIDIDLMVLSIDFE